MSVLGVPIPKEVIDAVAGAIADRVAALVEQRADKMRTPWMTVEEAAAYTRIPLGTFRKWSADGTLPSHGEGRRRIYHRDELDQVLLGVAPAEPTGQGGLRVA